MVQGAVAVEYDRNPEHGRSVRRAHDSVRFRYRAVLFRAHSACYGAFAAMPKNRFTFSDSFN